MLNLSFVIPSRGDLANLVRILSSISAQRLNDSLQIESIVVINGVTESDYAVLCHQLAHFVKTKFFYLPEANVNRARNKALFEAQGELVFFLDDDCELPQAGLAQKYIDLHRNESRVLALGGGYELAGARGLFDQIYNEIQMGWLLGQLGEVTGLSTEVVYLIGGHFCIKKEWLKKYNLKFNEDFAYGGTETEFFENIKNHKLPVKYVDLNVRHYTRESFLSLTRKMVKQGAGRAKIDELYPTQNTQETTRFNNKSTAHLKYRFWQAFFNYVFWFGYYRQQKSIFKLPRHLLKDLFGYLNYKRFEILNQIKRN